MAQPLPHKYPTPQPHTILQCAATIALKDNPSTLRYIEQEKPLTDEHCAIFHLVRGYVDDILSRKQPWKLTKFEPHLLSIIDHNFQHNTKLYATEDMYEYLQRYATTTSLLACCIGSDFELSAAAQCVVDIVQWRVQTRIDDIEPAQFRNALQTNAVYNIGECDKAGHPICHFRILSTLPDDPWVIVRAAVFTIEKGLRLAQQRGVYQLMWLLDLEHLSYSTMSPVQVVQQVNTLMTHFYPERLYKAYLLFTPWIFSTLLAMVTPVLPTKTALKLVNVGFTASSTYETFKHEIEAGQLKKKCGGQNDRIYDYQWELQQFVKHTNDSTNGNMKKKKTQLQVSGDDDEKKVMEEEEEEEEEKEKQTKSHGADVEDAKEEEEPGQDDSVLCIVCLDGARDHVMIPCGHIVVCGECKKEYSQGGAQCPMCRQTVQMIVKTYS